MERENLICGDGLTQNLTVTASSEHSPRHAVGHACLDNQPDNNDKNGVLPIFFATHR